MIYDPGNGAGYSVREVIERPWHVTGNPMPAVEAPRREEDPAHQVACSVRIQQELGRKPKHPELERITSTAWDWHRAHPRGYE